MKLLIAVFLFFPSIGIAEKVKLTHFQTHKRYDFGLRLLEASLKETLKSFELVGLENINEARGERLLEIGGVDFLFLSTNEDRERKFRPIKIPIYQGLLGCRLLLVRKKEVNRFESVNSLSDLKPFIGGHGAHWRDLPIYGANGLNVLPSKYPLIFKQLIAGRIDYFHRGVSEIWKELKDHSHKLGVANGIALFYKHPVYFFVNRENIKLEKQIKSGLEKMKKNGKFDRIFLDYHRDFIERAQLEERKLIILNNPILPKDAPLLDTKTWLSEDRQKLLRAKGL